MAIIDKIQLSGTVYTIGNETTTAVTSASTDNEIPTAKAVYDAIPQGGGGKAVSGGTNISITTGETADTINCILPYYRDSGNCWTIYGYNVSTNANNSTKAKDSVYIGYGNVINNTYWSNNYLTQNNIIIGFGNKLECDYTQYYLGGNYIIGQGNTLSGTSNIRESYVIGKNNKGYSIQEFICGWANEARNIYETSFGYRNISTSGVSTFGYSGNTLFSIGNGYYFGSDRHNAFEIRQNGDIYIADTNDTSTSNYYQKPMIKLQDALGGGGASYSAGTNISITTGETADTINCTLPIRYNNYYSVAVGHTANTLADYGSFTWGGTPYGSTSYNTVGQFSQAGGYGCRANGFYSLAIGRENSAKTAFSVALNGWNFTSNDYETALGTGNVSVSGSSAFGDSGNTLFSVGNGRGNGAINVHNAIEIRQNGDIYIADTNDTSTTNYYQKPMIKLQDTVSATTANTAALGGLSLVKLTQAQYDALATKDSNVLYVIVG